MTDELRAVTGRVYLGTGSAEDVTAVFAYLVGRYGERTPPDPKKAALWALSLYCGGRSKAKYRSVQHWIDDGKRRTGL